MVSAVVHPASTDIEATSNDIDAVNVLKANAQQAAKDLYQESEFDITKARRLSACSTMLVTESGISMLSSTSYKRWPSSEGP
ncbi:hypothetical protein GB937_006059 [Aspergillus fischeri]|nr:hypothetical protein GB937_006059 [Aspergillus fischeri]